jgi:hypothetical protein
VSEVPRHEHRPGRIMSNVNEWLAGLTALLSELAHRDDSIGSRAEGLGQSLPEVRKLLGFCGWDSVANACVAADCRCKAIPCGRPAKKLCNGGPECWCQHGAPAGVKEVPRG